MTTRRRSLEALAAGAAAMAAPRIARVAETTLTLSSWLPPDHPIVIGAYVPWIADILEATEGRVRIRLRAESLGEPPGSFERVRAGLADIAYGRHGFETPGRFTLTRLAEFSFLGDDAAELSAAYWATYTSMRGTVDEHAGAYLLSLYCHGPGCLHTASRPIRTLDDLRGLKIRTPGGYIAQLLEDLGVTPVPAPPSSVREMLNDGGVEGAAFALEALTAFDLIDPLNYTKTFPGGLYNTSWYVVMNPAAWAALERRDREALAALSGKTFARRIGRVWNEADRRAREVAEAGEIAIAAADDALVRAIMPVATRLEEAWVIEAERRGVDGRSALAAVREANNVVLPT